MATDYFTKWIEAEPLSSITEQDTKNFVWKSIVTRFGIPRTLISDNGTQFDSNFFRNFCQELDIKNVFSTPAYPQSNSQAEISNKVVLDGLKKRLDRAKGRWAEELPSVLWVYNKPCETNDPTSYTLLIKRSINLHPFMLDQLDKVSCPSTFVPMYQRALNEDPTGHMEYPLLSF